MSWWLLHCLLLQLTAAIARFSAEHKELTFRCNKGVSTKDISISAALLESNEIESRTNIECMMICRKRAGCSSIFVDKLGKCYELLETEIQQRGDGPVTQGELIQFYSPQGNPNSCGGVVCSDGQFCSRGCYGNEWSNEMCVADQQLSCDLEQEFTNLMHYWSSALEYDGDNGPVMSLFYTKKTNESGLRVTSEMSFRAKAHGYCGRMFFKFNGQECSDPAVIGMVDYFQIVVDHHRASDIDGTCYGISAGSVLVQVYVAPCLGTEERDLYTGFQAARTLTVMEINPQSPPKDQTESGEDKPCPQSAVLNYQYFTWDGNVSETFDTSASDFLIKSVTYTKMASDTSIRIKYSGVMGIVSPEDSHSYCGRWFLAINGTECSPRADGIIYHESVNSSIHWSSLLRVYSIEGICDNELPAGKYSVELRIGACINIATRQPTNFVSGGGLTPSRMHIEEVRMVHSVNAVVTASKSVYRSLTGYLSRYYYYALNNGAQVGTILTAIYDKQYADTNLKLTATGSHMHQFDRDPGRCSKWYFLIDDIECADPGVIEGAIIHPISSRSHKPSLTSGICNGISQGRHSIKYAVGRCSGALAKGITYTGMGSSFSIIVEELRVESTVVCSGEHGNPLECP